VTVIYTPTKQAATASAAPARTRVCVERSGLLPHFLTALQAKGCCGALRGGGPVASPSQSPGNSWPQCGPYSASIRLITSVPAPELK